MSNVVAFIGDGGKAEIEVRGYENPRAVDPDDANWLRASLNLEAGPFKGAFDLTMTTHDLVVLRERIEAQSKAATGKAEFETTEADLALTVEFSASGKVQILGVAQPSTCPGAALHFRFESSLDYLGNSLQQLADLISSFPIRQLTS